MVHADLLPDDVGIRRLHCLNVHGGEAGDVCMRGGLPCLVDFLICCHDSQCSWQKQIARQKKRHG